MVAGTWKRGHARRGEGGTVRLLPLSDAEIDGEDLVDDLGEAPFIDIPAPAPPRSAGPPPAPPEPPAGGPGAGDDDGPRHARRGWQPKQAPRPPRGGSKIRITATTRGDIAAKISMPLEIIGRIWEARDPLCGGVFLRQRPDIADAFTDIVCESADLVAFFTGPGGAFMKYLNAGAALWPVIEVAAAHHVYHTITAEAADSDAAAGAGRYAA